MRHSSLALCLLLTGMRVAVAADPVSSGGTTQGVTVLQIPHGISAYKGHSRTDGVLAKLHDEYRAWQARAATRPRALGFRSSPKTRSCRSPMAM
jgi:hypothetical protein